MSLNTIFKNIKKKYLSSTHLLRTYSLPFLLACSGSAQSFTSQENGQNDTQHDAGSPLSETCADADKDDFYASKKCGTPVDCNDYNSAAYPGAREYCDGLDNNCNGTIDENPPKLLYADRDGDGFGNPQEKVQSCFPPRDPKGEEISYVPAAGDCDDDNPSINPNAEDLCDYLDNDCDGIADNMFPEAGSECYEGTGECRRSGKYECSADGRELLCPATPGMSIEEICNGIDDDCDGETDEELEAETRTCYAGQGECRRSGLEYRVCEGKAGWSADYRNCDAPVVPAGEERCDEIDHDCDGNNYNGFNVGEDCAVGEGECFSRGEYACTADGRGTFCDVGIVDAEEERCDGLDNDCDGEVDEGAGIINVESCLAERWCSALFSDSGDVALDGSSPASGASLTETGWLANADRSERTEYSNAFARSGSLSLLTEGYNGAGVHYTIEPGRENFYLSVWYRADSLGADRLRLSNQDNSAWVDVLTARFCGSTSSHQFEYHFQEPSGPGGRYVALPGVPEYQENRWYHLQIQARGRNLVLSVDDGVQEGGSCIALSEPVEWTTVTLAVDRCGGGSREVYWDDLMAAEE